MSSLPFKPVSRDATTHITSHFNSKVFQAAAERKARISTFYINGDQFASGLRVSILINKDFKDLDALCNYLTEKTNILNGVRYIFTLDGKRVKSLENIQHNHSYVISGVKHFQPLTYGKTEKLRSFNKLKHESRLRPISPRFKFTFPYETFSSPKINSVTDGKIITIVNGDDASLRTRIFLNSSNPGSFEMILKDIGQAVMIPNAKKMYTMNGQEVSDVTFFKL